MRIEIIYREKGIDGRAIRVLKALQSSVSAEIEEVAIADIYLTKGRI